MPLVVFQAESGKAKDDATVEYMVEQLRLRHVEGELICFDLKEHANRTDAGKKRNQDQYDAAFDLLDSLSNASNWGGSNLPRSRRLAFPRSLLVKAIAEAAESGSGKNALDELRKMRWRPRSSGSRKWLAGEFKAVTDVGNLFGAVVLLVVTTVLGQSSWRWPLVLLVLLFLLFGLWRVLPLFRPQLLWLSPVNRWFSRSTFLAAGQGQAGGKSWSWWRPLRSGRVMTRRADGLSKLFAAAPRSTALTRARDADAPQEEPAGTEDTGRHPPLPRALATLAARLVPAGWREPAASGTTEVVNTKQYLLQLRTLALLEDLRALYRPWMPDLRRRKRPTPPIIFFPRATEDSGTIALLDAINDIRCRRSEVDPLLVIAGVDRAGMRKLSELSDSGLRRPPSGEWNVDVYAQWEDGLLLGQSPNGRPWILHRRISREDMEETAWKLTSPQEPARSLWVRMWSVWTLAAVLVVAVLAAGRFGQDYEHRYCGSRILFGNHDLRRVPDLEGTGVECIGVTDRAYPFDDGGFRLNGGTPQNPGTGPGEGVTVSTVENWITASNATIGNSPHVTVVYAGQLSTWQDQPTQVRNGLEELAGVYLAQQYVNSGNMDGPKIRVLIANGGQELRHQYLMAQQIVRMAKNDPTISAVVGLGRDADDSAKTVGLLERSGLAVVDTTNSSPTLASDSTNYFGLAATDQEEANALTNVLPRTSRESPALVVTRTPQGTDDQYSPQQRKAATTALTQAGYKVRQVSYTSGSDTSFSTAIDTICGGTSKVIYLAGRAEEFSALLSSIAGNGSCGRPLDLLTGDDLTKLDFDTSTSVPSNVQVYFAALADPAVTGQQSALLNSEQDVPQLSEHNPRASGKNTDLPAAILSEPMFEDGTLSLGYEATEVVQNAADSAGAVDHGYRYAVLAQLRRTVLANQPTGWVDFEHFPQIGTATGHGIVIYGVTHSDEGKPTLKLTCDTLSGMRSLKAAPAPAAAPSGSSAGKGSVGTCDPRRVTG
ncbi:ABC transporter substrate-binding protein [Streptantibioticus silvisoli]|uniref:ABC transporter substrate-binding protein n=1 Tax=Streptantibioticus silvisoli TaxID=2705255 RepID=A0ABT6W822_9ACTN|nr:ABC transporter substrate-binding protein [Streptantibioticus silvisoli]MDI5965631.1 ABC transporter substrate-binding protein [Streptantibioticus silvisoli]